MAVRLLGALVVCLLLVAAPARADPTFEVTVTPQAASFPETRELTYRVKITTTEPERFRLGASGVGLASPVAAVLEGPGAMTPPPPPQPRPVVFASPRLSFPSCGDGLGFRTSHHDFPRGLSYDLDLPADAVSTVVLTAALSRDAPRPTIPGAPPRPGIPPAASAAGENYWMGFSASNQTAGSTLDQSYLEIPAPVVAAAGRKGVWITLALDPPGRPCEIPQNPGEPVTVTGTTNPPVAGEDMTLMVAHRAPNAAPVTVGELATVTTADDGTFGVAAWRPQQGGRYALQAQFRSKRPDLADDFSAPVSFDLSRPVPLPAAEPWRPGPRPVPLPELATVARDVSVRGRVARVRLRCPRPDGCRGVVRLKVRRAFSDWRSFRIAAGKEKVVTVRIGPSIRRVLQDRRLDGVAQVRLNDHFSRTPVKLRALPSD
jgi:hypothetical protein